MRGCKYLVAGYLVLPRGFKYLMTDHSNGPSMLVYLLSCSPILISDSNSPASNSRIS